MLLAPVFAKTVTLAYFRVKFTNFVFFLVLGASGKISSQGHNIILDSLPLRSQPSNVVVK